MPRRRGAASDVIASSPDLSALFSDQLALLGQVPTDPNSGAALVAPGASQGAAQSTGFPVYVIGLLAIFGLGALLAVATIVRRRVRFAGKSGREVATIARHDLESFLADQGDPLGAELTLEELGNHVSRRYGVDASPFAGALTLARFGDPTVVPAAADVARDEHGRLMRALRGSIGPARRLRGALHIGGLRLAYRRHRPARSV